MNTRKLLLKITDKWPAKVLSVAAALIISVFYRLNTLESRIFTVPLKIEYSDSFLPADTVTNTIRVTIRGDAQNLNAITDEDIEAYIDLNRYVKEGTFRVPVKIRKKGSAAGIEPLEISVSPMEINLKLEEKVSRYFHVYPVFTGTITSGYEITSQSVTPESVIAEGPRSSLENIREFETEPIDIDNRNYDFTIFVPIKNENQNIVIYGNKLIEFSCTINRIERATLFSYLPVMPEDDETDEDFEENGDSTE